MLPAVKGYASGGRLYLVTSIGARLATLDSLQKLVGAARVLGGCLYWSLSLCLSVYLFLRICGYR
jgi:hypothetical protein